MQKRNNCAIHIVNCISCAMKALINNRIGSIKPYIKFEKLMHTRRILGFKGCNVKVNLKRIEKNENFWKT